MSIFVSSMASVTMLLVLIMSSVAGAVDLAACNADVRDRLGNRTLTSDNPIFYFNGTSFMSDRNNLQLTIEGCRATCPKPDFDLYGDMWPRLLTWLVPALLLIGNVHIPRVGSLNRFFVVLHFVGDPIDSVWSLLTKAEVWNRFYAIALRLTPPGPDRESMARSLAAMLSAFEELTDDMAAVQQEFESIVTDTTSMLTKEDLDYILVEAADELVDSRTNEVLRTILVIANYCWTILGALVPEIGGTQSSQPGGRIGTAMYLSWLVTAVLLSNTLSGFTSRRTCLRIMERYCRTIKGRHRDLHVFPNSPRLSSKSGWTFGDKNKTKVVEPVDYMESQPWNGSAYSFRPRKSLIPGGKKDSSQFYLLSLSIAPVFVAATCAFVIIWFTPTVGLGCRTLWVIGNTSGLFVSAALTGLINKLATGKLAWYLTIGKDALLGIPALAVIILSSIGLFNTCWCWSGVYSRGYANAFITLDPVNERLYNAHHIYPAMVGTCLLLQLAIYGLMHRMMSPGAKVFRPDEDTKMEQYRRIHGLGSPESEMKSTTGNRRSRGSKSGASDMAETADMLLPPPAISPHVSPRLSPQAQRTRSVSPSDYFAVGAQVGDRPGSVSSYGGSPEWRTADQPLLGSPVISRR